MILGVVSNSQGRVEAMATAVAALRTHGAETIIHCGDVGGRHVLDAMSPDKLPGGGFFVWGDRDRERTGLMRHAQSIDVGCFGALGEFELGGKQIVVIHGDDRKFLTRLIDEQKYDYILHGHAATPEDRTVGRTRVLNPGPLHAGANRSALLLDIESGEARQIDI